MRSFGFYNLESMLVDERKKERGGGGQGDVVLVMLKVRASRDSFCFFDEGLDWLLVAMVFLRGIRTMLFLPGPFLSFQSVLSLILRNHSRTHLS